MANAFYSKMKAQREQDYSRGIQDGMRLAYDLVTIALNHLYGFGDQRITALEKEVQSLADEITDMNDAEVTRAHINRALSQIRGKEFVQKYRG